MAINLIYHELNTILENEGTYGNRLHLDGMKGNIGIFHSDH